MSRPKLEVNDVWILQEIIPYEGSTIIGVFFNPEVAKAARPDVKRWYVPTLDPDGFSSAAQMDYETFYYISKHPVRIK